MTFPKWDLRYRSNVLKFVIFRLAISNTFGYVRQSSDLPVVPKPLPIARPNLSTPVGLSAASLVSSLGGNQLSDARELLNSIVNGMGSGISPSLVTDAAKAYGAVAQGFDTIPGLTTDNFAANYERWSNASSDIYQVRFIYTMGSFYLVCNLSLSK